MTPCNLSGLLRCLPVLLLVGSCANGKTARLYEGWLAPKHRAVIVLGPVGTSGLALRVTRIDGKQGLDAVKAQVAPGAHEVELEWFGYSKEWGADLYLWVSPLVLEDLFRNRTFERHSLDKEGGGQRTRRIVAKGGDTYFPGWVGLGGRATHNPRVGERKRVRPDLLRLEGGGP